MTWVFPAILFGVAGFVAVWFVRYARSVIRGDYRHPEGRKQTWWVPGGGTHGEGQIPPLLPDSDPDDEIR